MKISRTILCTIILLLLNGAAAIAQPTLQSDYSYSLEIPSITAMESSAAHMYVLSEAEGMAVFRTHRDSLQWLYTSAGMQQRGTTLRADIRFAYLFGTSHRLTVLEPTSVMGAFSSTTLPQPPLDVQRLNDNLYVALGTSGLGKLSLQSPEGLDSPVQNVASTRLANKNIIDLVTTDEYFLALANDQTLFYFDKNRSDISLRNSVSLANDINRLFWVNQTLLGGNNEGGIFEISPEGETSELGRIGEPVNAMAQWKDWLIIKGNSGRLWTSYQSTEPTLWKQNGDAGNFFTISKGQLWLAEYNRISRIREGTGNSKEINRDAPVSSADFEIKAISDQILPYPNPLLIPLKLKTDYPVQNVEFNIQTDADEAVIRGQSLYWQPPSRNAGTYSFKIIASTAGGRTSATSFTVDVRPFNAPPRFTPLRTISIPVGRTFNLPVKAMDPDSDTKSLIRYLGVNLPNGASIDEQTGEFDWTPTERQIGKNSFRVIATDKYGAASSVDVTIRVIETSSTGQ